MKKPRRKKRPITASEMAKRRWRGTTKAQRVELATAAINARWHPETKTGTD